MLQTLADNITSHLIMGGLCAAVGRLFLWAFKKEMTRKQDYFFWVFALLGVSGISYLIDTRFLAPLRPVGKPHFACTIYGLSVGINTPAPAPAPTTPATQANQLKISGGLSSEPPGKYTSVFLETYVTNSGAQSVIARWKLIAEVAKGPPVISENVIRTPITMRAVDGKQEIRPPMDRCTLCILHERPLPNGAGFRGWMAFVFPEGAYEEVSRVGTKFTLELTDVLGQKYTAETTMTADKRMF